MNNRRGFLGAASAFAVKGAVDDAKLGNLTAMLANIAPAVEKVRDFGCERSFANAKMVQAAAD